MAKTLICILIGVLFAGPLFAGSVSLAWDTFEGYFGRVNAAVGAITEVVGANPDASDAHASISKLSQVPTVEIAISAA